jgi:hypothetical protein
MKIELIGVPYASAATPGGIATAIRVLREEGLVEELRRGADVRDGGDLELPEGTGSRGPSGLLNELARRDSTGTSPTGSATDPRRPSAAPSSASSASRQARSVEAPASRTAR